MNLLKKQRGLVQFLIGVIIATGSISCSEDESGNEYGQRNNEQVIANFKSYLYKDGKVHATQLATFASPTEWAVAVNSPEKPLEVFSDITGIETTLTESYEYNYTSSDKTCSIRIVGQSKATSSGVYATMYIQMEGCEEIEVLHVATRDYFNGTNGGFLNDVAPGVPVIW